MRPATNQPLTVGDLFCGAGGFAEWFRQANFKIERGVDHRAPAVETSKCSFPGVRAIQSDVLELDDADLAPVGVLIDSPQCVHFSSAGREGAGTARLG